MSERFVTAERQGDLVRVWLDRPPLNLLTAEVAGQLRDIFLALRGDESVRAAVIAGRGRVLTAGMQLEVLRDLDSSSARTFISLLCEAIESVHSAPCPTVAVLHGHCLGAGFELALACDLRIASNDCRMGLPEVRVGIPSVIHAALLPALVGPGRVAELLLTGESVGAEQALAWGLVNRVAPPEQLGRVTDQLLGQILACGPRAMRLQKDLMVHWRGTDLRSAIHYGINALAQAYSSDEPHEAMTAFLEERPPRFSGPERGSPPRSTARAHSGLADSGWGAARRKKPADQSALVWYQFTS